LDNSKPVKEGKKGGLFFLKNRDIIKKKTMKEGENHGN